MKFKNAFFFILSLTLLSACIQDDFVDDRVDPVLRILTAVDTLKINTAFQLEAMYLNNVGNEVAVTVEWSSSNSNVLTVNASGLVSAIGPGSATITVEYDDPEGLLSDAISITVGEETVVVTNQSAMGTIQTTSTYALSGDFEFRETDTGVDLEFAENYSASTALPGLFVYLSNNRNSIANAFEIGAVQVFNGAHNYSIDNIGFNDYQFIVYFCKPFNVKVGDGEL